MKKIHPTAIVDKDSIIGEGVEIGPYSVIGKNVIIGDGTYVGPHCVIEYARIGKNNKFIASAYIGLPPQDYKYNDEETYVEIGDDNIIRECVSIHRGTPTGRKITRVGSGCFFMANSHVAHDCIVGNKVIMVNSSALAGHTIVEDNAILSGLVGVHQFTRIGKFAMIAGGSMVNQDIIPFVIAKGDRAKPVGLNIVGLKRNGFDYERIKAIKNAFKVIFYSGLKLEDSLLKLENENPTKDVLDIINFCRQTKRGIARPREMVLGDE
jgi:UDP-N-acetylglucosamine acyltransferase